jgi:mannose-6-phosphate isomerase-like protein (cupin superfamily)
LHSFNGAIYTTNLKTPNHAFAAEVVFFLQHPLLLTLGSQKPPLHFHPYQEEYIQVTEGKLAVELNGKEKILTREDSVFCIKPWAHHRLYPPPNDGSEVTKFILSGAETDEQYHLDNLFFSNWYAYQDRIFVKGETISLIQVMSVSNHLLFYFIYFRTKLTPKRCLMLAAPTFPSHGGFHADAHCPE